MTIEQLEVFLSHPSMWNKWATVIRFDRDGNELERFAVRCGSGALTTEIKARGNEGDRYGLR